MNFENSTLLLVGYSQNATISPRRFQGAVTSLTRADPLGRGNALRTHVGDAVMMR